MGNSIPALHVSCRLHTLFAHALSLPHELFNLLHVTTVVVDHIDSWRASLQIKCSSEHGIQCKGKQTTLGRAFLASSIGALTAFFKKSVVSEALCSSCACTSICIGFWQPPRRRLGDCGMHMCADLITRLRHVTEACLRGPSTIAEFSAEFWYASGSSAH